MSGRTGALAVALIGCVLVVGPAVVPPSKRLVFNATASVPVGFYWMDKGPLSVGDLVLVRPPSPLARWMAARRYLPFNVPLIKHIAAVGGQHVCVRNGKVFVEGRLSGKVVERDQHGRQLLPSKVCRRLKVDELFLLNQARRSLDSRYFGPLPRQCVVGRLSPVWTWGR